MVDMPSLYSPLSPLGDPILDSPLCGELIGDMEVLEDISQSLSDDTFNSLHVLDYQSNNTAADSSTDVLTPASSPSSEVFASSTDENSSGSLALECRVCADRASGFHYGVHACEGCKVSSHAMHTVENSHTSAKSQYQNANFFLLCIS
uniref:Nuclear receptor domain-containing protein n=1 Tax=Sinocyclocheilus anshuiensis TaxID=1608454 RepID=A0A671L2F4_9TELE